MIAHSTASSTHAAESASGELSAGPMAWPKLCLPGILAEHVLAREPDAIPFKNAQRLNVGIHGHCHAKALTDISFMPKLVEKVPGASATLLDTGCCGMAGAFGMLKSKYELSKQVAQDLVDKIKELPADTTVVAAGTSCRHQIGDFANKHPKHMAEILADAL